MHITWWRHQMKTFFALLALCAGNSPATGGFTSKRPMTWSFNAVFDLSLNKPLSKENASDLRRHRAHYDVNVMRIIRSLKWKKSPISLDHLKMNFLDKYIIFKRSECRTFVWHLRKTIYAHVPFGILHNLFLIFSIFWSLIRCYGL